MEVFHFDWQQRVFHLLKVIGAFALTLPIAWERERTTRAIGLRTFPLVAVASCGYVLIASVVVGENAEAQARIIQGLMTGIGFIGGGAILKEAGSVRGTATAASIWSTGAVGGAIAYNHIDIALVISLINFLTLRLFTHVKDQPAAEEQEQAKRSL